MARKIIKKLAFCHPSWLADWLLSLVVLDEVNNFASDKLADIGDTGAEKGGNHAKNIKISSQWQPKSFRNLWKLQTASWRRLSAKKVSAGSRQDRRL